MSGAVGFFVDDLFEAADLAGGEIVVEDDDVGVFLDCEGGDFLDFAAADVGAGIDALAALEDVSDDFGAGGFGEGGEFAEGVARIGGGFGQNHANEDGAFAADCEFGSGSLGHGGHSRSQARNTK